tara:strand:- start:794 stop:982 length:189 start_codon:yes stop_codon:yes gene_type:complete
MEKYENSELEAENNNLKEQLINEKKRIKELEKTIQTLNDEINNYKLREEQLIEYKIFNKNKE